MKEQIIFKDKNGNIIDGGETLRADDGTLYEVLVLVTEQDDLIIVPVNNPFCEAFMLYEETASKCEIVRRRL